VVVVGGGPIGSYTAYQLADKGFSVCIVDSKNEIGNGVVCAGVISKDSFKQYDLPAESILSRIDSLTFVSPSGQRLEYIHPDVLAYVVDRDVFDKSLFNLARRLGTETKLRSRVEGIYEEKNHYVVHGRNFRLRAKIVVIATGIEYKLQKQLGMGSPSRMLYGSQIELPFSMSASVIEIHMSKEFAPASFGWIVPAAQDRARIGLLVDRRGKHWLKRMIRQRLGYQAGSCSDSQIKMKPIAYGPVQRSVRGRIIAVGEAAGQVKTTTGGGIFFGLLCSEIAVEKIARVLKSGTSLDDYEVTWRSALTPEIDIGFQIRKVAAGLSDMAVETLFSFVKRNRLWVKLLIPRIKFDYHSDLLFFCMKSFSSILKLKDRIV
jgi:geranylgeranyl reductase family protein